MSEVGKTIQHSLESLRQRSSCTQRHGLARGGLGKELREAVRWGLHPGQIEDVPREQQRAAAGESLFRDGGEDPFLRYREEPRIVGAVNMKVARNVDSHTCPRV